MTSQPTSIRRAARYCFTVGAENSPLQLLHEGGDVKGLHVGELAASH